MKLIYKPCKETKTCYVYQTGEPRTPEHQTLYLKKALLEAEGLDPRADLTVTIGQEGTDDT